MYVDNVLILNLCEMVNLWFLWNPRFNEVCVLSNLPTTTKNGVYFVVKDNPDSTSLFSPVLACFGNLEKIHRLFLQSTTVNIQ